MVDPVAQEVGQATVVASQAVGLVVQDSRVVVPVVQAVVQDGVVLDGVVPDGVVLDGVVQAFRGHALLRIGGGVATGGETTGGVALLIMGEDAAGEDEAGADQDGVVPVVPEVLAEVMVTEAASAEVGSLEEVAVDTVVPVVVARVATVVALVGMEGQAGREDRAVVIDHKSSLPMFEASDKGLRIYRPY